MQRRRNIKKRLFFLLFCIIVISIFISWRVIVSPQYSLKQLKKSMANNNTITFDKYVDLDRAADSAIEQIWYYYSTPLPDKKKNLWIDLRNEISQSLLSVVKPNLKEMLKKEVYNSIATGKMGGADYQKDSSLSAILLRMVREKVNPDDWQFQSINYIEVKKDLAYLGLTYFDQTKQANFFVDIKMKKMPGFWQVTEVTNINQLLNLFLNR